MHTHLFPIVLTVALALPAQTPGEGWKDLTGKEAPDIEVKSWLNTGGVEPKLETLRNKVWVLFFFVSTFEPATEKLDLLSDLHKKYFDVGFRVVAVSSEPEDKLKKEIVEGRKTNAWVGSDPMDLTHSRYATGEQVTLPHAFVIGSDGKVIGTEIPEDATLRELLEKPYKLSQDLHAKLARARVAYNAGAYGAAVKLAEATKTDPDATVAVDAALLCNKINGHAEFRKALLLADPESEPNARYGTLLRYAFQYAGLEPAKWAQTQLADLKKNDKVKSFLPEWTKLEDAMRTEMQAEGKPDKLKAAKQAYDAVSKKYARSLVGKLASEYSARLDSIGK